MRESKRAGGHVNAFTVDVEDYFHVSAFSSVIDRSTWDSISPRVESHTIRVLDVLDEFNVRGTFFVLGWVAERFPGLVREIGSRGHEVACHGYSHELIYKQSRDEFREETLRAKHLLEDIVGAQVLGYRAASYSITRESYWALDIISEAGFTYDSSIFPIRHDRYGDSAAPRFPHRLTLGNGHTLEEFPLSTWQVLGYRVPIAGGGYFRLFPYWLTRTGLRAINDNESMPFIFYIHPWELDVDQPHVRSGLATTFRHRVNLHRVEKRLRRLLVDFAFTSAANAMAALKSRSQRLA